MTWTEVARSVDTYTGIDPAELLDESGNALLDESGVLLIDNSSDTWTVQVGTGEPWTDI